ncbi:ABC transporter permease [Streptomyces sp. KM273126]|uniref:ABC transporter permease n=1 Tax=Streptomyces sp. KM273126 TaxID=2545247 RepID=UPI0010387657|nr:ABC transporter permease [Streptomyces sp. KM273126]MBA2807258.1 ABC transporter permease [Streptomyces sp. KM273126]
MTAVPTAPAEAPALRRSLRPRGLVWTMLCLHRAALLFWALLVAVAAGTLLWAWGPGTKGLWTEYRTMRCAFSGQDFGQDLSCDYTGDAYMALDLATSLGGLIITIVPFLVAVWASGALIARELETGTAELAWTQSVSPARWLAAKLAVPAVLLASGTALLTLLHRLMWPSDRELLRWLSWQWYDDVAFRGNGPVAVAYALLGLAVGVLVGLLVHRSLPALGISLVCLLAVHFALVMLRPYLWPSVTLTKTDQYSISGGMPVDDGAITPLGNRVPNPCGGEGPGCLTQHHIAGFYFDYHPSSHFWPLQLVETGIVLSLAALAVLASFRLLNRHTGDAA